MSRRRVLLEHTSAELTEWRAFDTAFGLEYAADARAGVVAAAIWNAAGGVPEGKQRRAAKPSDFFANLDLDGDQTIHGRPVSHDDAAREPDDVDDDVDVDDEEAEIARASEAMKNAWAMWGLKHNARLRAAAEQVGERLPEPPPDPEVN